MAGPPGLLAAAAQGVIATGVMSAVMIAGDRVGLIGEQPPVAITRKALRVAGVDRPAGAAAVVGPVAHLAFGAGGGMTYGLVRRLVPNVPRGWLGGAFGLAVWAVSYEGWIPALRILPAVEDDRPCRPAVMVVAHVLYGLVLGWLHR